MKLKHLVSTAVGLLIIIFSLIPICTYSQIIINEVQSSNASTIADNFGDFDDWIELYNPDDGPIDISGLVLKDNIDTWQIPANTVIQPQNFLLLWADDEEEQGAYHTNFKLSAANGEFLGLFASDSITEIESVNIPPLSEDQSYGKCIDGSWSVMSDPTPLILNDCQLTNTNDLSDDLMVYPNPSDGTLQVDLGTTEYETIDFHLYSINGKLVLEKPFHLSSFTIDLNNLDSDIYILKIKIDKVLYIKKIVLAK